MPKPKAHIYCRVSSTGQQDNYSFETQEKACREFAEANGYAVDGVTLEVWTGAEFWERPKLGAIRERVRTGQIDAVVCYAIDRLSRDIAHLAVFGDECDRQNVKLLFVTESFDDSAEGKLIRSVRGYTAEIERQKIKERVTRGQKARVASGKLPHGSGKLYGYTQDRETTARQIHPIESEIVKRIWNEAFHLGLGALTIARRLNREQIPSPASQKRKWPDGRVPQWSKSAVLEILKNPAYAGLSYAFRYQSQRVNGKITHKLRNASEWVLLPDSLTPAIVSREMFEAMPARLASRRVQADGARNLVRPVLLRGFVFCVCGRRRSFDPTHGYRCPNRSAVKRDCQSSATPAAALDEAVWREVLKLIAKPSVIRQLIERAAKSQTEDQSSIRNQAERLEITIRRNRAKQEKLLASFGDDDTLSPMIEAQIRALAKDNQSLESELKAAREKLSRTSASALRIDDLIMACKKLKKIKNPTIENRRALFAALNLRVVTDGRKDWKIEWGVRLPESGHRGLNLTLFSAERPHILDGRARMRGRLKIARSRT